MGLAGKLHRIINGHPWWLRMCLSRRLLPDMAALERETAVRTAVPIAVVDA